MKKIPKHWFLNVTKLDKLILTVTIVSLLFICLISLNSINTNIQNQETLVHDTLSSLAQNGRQQFTDYIQNKVDILTYISNFPEIYEMDPEKQKSYLYNRAHLIGFRHIYIIDTDGNSYYINENIHRNQQGEPFFQSIMSQDVFITEPSYNPDTRTTYLTLAVSIYNQQQEKVGVLCGAISIDEFKKVFFENQKDSRCFVVDEAGTYMVSDQIQNVHNKLSIYDHTKDDASLLQNVINTHEDQYGKMTFQTDTYYTYVTYINDFHWILGYQLPISTTSQNYGYINTLAFITLLEVIILIFCIYHIVSLWHKSNQKLYTDPLTHCSSRLALLNMLHRLEKQHNTEIALLYMDLNDFKQINDTYGHDKGDLILCMFGETLMTVLGKSGMVARMGGDEFVAVLLDETEASINEKWRQVQNLLHEKSLNLPFDCQIDSSYGYSFRHRGEETSLEEILQQADEMMYCCKKKMHKNR